MKHRIDGIWIRLRSAKRRQQFMKFSIEKIQRTRLETIQNCQISRSVGQRSASNRTAPPSIYAISGMIKGGLVFSFFLKENFARCSPSGYLERAYSSRLPRFYPAHRRGKLFVCIAWAALMKSVILPLEYFDEFLFYCLHLFFTS